VWSAEKGGRWVMLEVGEGRSGELARNLHSSGSTRGMNQIVLNFPN